MYVLLQTEHAMMSVCFTFNELTNNRNLRKELNNIGWKIIEISFCLVRRWNGLIYDLWKVEIILKFF